MTSEDIKTQESKPDTFSLSLICGMTSEDIKTQESKPDTFSLFLICGMTSEDIQTQESKPDTFKHKNIHPPGWNNIMLLVVVVLIWGGGGGEGSVCVCVYGGWGVGGAVEGEKNNKGEHDPICHGFQCHTQKEWHQSKGKNISVQVFKKIPK